MHGCEKINSSQFSKPTKLKPNQPKPTMAPKATQRRGKKTQPAATGSSGGKGEGLGNGGNTTATTTTTASNGNNNSMDIQLQAAQQKVIHNQANTSALHSQWKSHLCRLSYLVILLSLHQWHKPMSKCLYDVKTYNKSITPLDDQEHLTITYLQAIWFMCQDTVCELLSICMAILLSIFLKQQYNQSEIMLINTKDSTQINNKSFFSNPLYMITTTIFVPIINIYFHQQSKRGNNNDVESTSHHHSCLEFSSIVRDDHTFWQQLQQADGEDGSTASTTRNGGGGGFPVVLVFHVIATACLWFMNMQQSQQQRNLQLLEKLKQEYAKVTKKK